MIRFRSSQIFALLFLGGLILRGIVFANESEFEKGEIIKARAAFDNKQYYDSSRKWKKLIDQYPENALYYFNYAQTQYQRKKYAESIKGHRHVIKLRSPLSPASRFYIASIYADTGRDVEAINILKGVIQSDVSKGIRVESMRLLEQIDPREKEKRRVKDLKKLNAPIEYPIGLKFFKQGKYKLAIINLQMAAVSYDAPELYLIRGISYYKLGHEKSAQSDLERAVVKSDDPDVRKNAEMLLTLINQKKNRMKRNKDSSDWIMSFDTSINYNSSPLTLSEVGRKTGRSQVDFVATLGRKLLITRELALNAVYDGSLLESIESVENRFVEHQFSVPVRSRIGALNLTFRPFYTYEESGSDPYDSKYGGTASFTKNFKNRSRLGISGKRVQSRGASTEYSYLNGNGQYLRGTIGWRKRRFDLSYSVIYSMDRFRDDEDHVLSNNAFGQTLSLHIFPIDDFVVSCSVNYQDKRYAKNPISNFSRIDRNTSLSLGINYNASDSLAFYVTSNISFIDTNINSSITIDSSTVAEDLFDFQESISFGLTMDVF